MAIRKEEVDNPMLRTMPIKLPLQYGKCACGCGDLITEQYAFIRFEGRYFSEDRCLRKYLAAHFDYEEVG